MAFGLADRTERTRESPAVAWSAPWARGAWQDAVVALMVGAVLLWPVVTLIVNGLTPTGMAEESVGRRYFYSLRILYGDHERPFLPQGQLTTVAHFLVHLGLTAAGFPPTQLFPRIDLFAFAASSVPIVLATLAFGWAVRPIDSLVGKLLVALLLLIAVFDPATSRGYHLVQTDYYSWVHAVALVGVGAALRAADPRSALGRRSGFALGAFATVAISLKPTWVIFVLPAALLLLAHGVARRAWIEIGGAVLAAFVTTVVGVVVVHLVYYGGDLDALAGHAANLMSFVDGIDRPQAFPTWLGIGLERWARGEMLPYALGLLPVLALSALFLPNRAVSLSLLAGGAASVFVAWRKFHPNTLIETNDYAFLAIVVWADLVLTPALRVGISLFTARFSAASRTGPPLLPIAGLVVALVLGAGVAERVAGGRADMLRSFGASTSATRALAAYLDGSPGGVAFLIPENNFRPLTVDSAIFKGGTNEVGARWGDSPLVYKMFPDRYYFIDGLHPDRDPDVEQFRHIVYVRLPSESDEDKLHHRLRKSFGIWPRSYDCDFRADLIYQEIVACERQSVSLAASDVREASFVPLGGDVLPTAGLPEPAASGSAAWLMASERIDQQGLDLVLVRPDGSMAVVEAPEGARTRVLGVGAWDAGARRLAGLDATYRGGRLWLDDGGLEAGNPSSRFDRAGPRRQPLVGWQVEPRDAPPSVERLSDDDGPFVRLRPALEGTSIYVNGRAPLSSLDDTPVTVRAVVRAHGPKPVTITISDVVGHDGQSATLSASTRSSDTWETITVWLLRASYPDDRDSFSVKLADPAEGGWMDLREVSLIQGIVP